MKKVSLVLSVLSVLAFGQQVSAEVVGTCTLESNRSDRPNEVFGVYERAQRPYGLVAEGFSSLRDRVYLTENFAGRVSVHVQSPGTSLALFVPRNENCLTHVELEVLLEASDLREEAQWLSCQIDVDV